MKKFLKVLVILIGTAMTAVLMLAFGNIYVIPEQVLKPLFSSDMWKLTGQMFTFCLLPGSLIGYTACQSRIAGAITYVGFIVLGIIVGINIWWIITLILLLLSFIFCINENVGDYDDLDAYDKLGVVIPLVGAFRFIDKLGLEDILNLIGKILSVLLVICSVILPVFCAFADVNIANETVVGKSLVGFKGLVDWSQTMFGASIINAFLPLASVFILKYLFGKGGLTKVFAVLFCGYNAYRGAFIFIPILMRTDPVSGGQMETENPLFNNLFGTEASVVVLLLLTGVLGLYMAFHKKIGVISEFCLSDSGAPSINIILLCVYMCTALYIIAPAITFALWIVMVLLFMFGAGIMLGQTRTPYHELRHGGASHEEACRRLGLDPLRTPGRSGM